MLKINKTIVRFLIIVISTSLINTSVVFADIKGNVTNENIVVENKLNMEDINNLKVEDYLDALEEITTPAAVTIDTENNSITLDISDSDIIIEAGIDGKIKVSGNQIEGGSIEISKDVSIIITGGSENTSMNLSVYTECLANIIISSAYIKGDVGGGNITVKSGTITGSIYGGNSYTDTGATVTINGGIIEGNVYSGGSRVEDAGEIIINGGTVKGNVNGGPSHYKNGGTVTINGGIIEGNVDGGISYAESAGAVTINGGIVKQSVSGGMAYLGSGGVITINGGTVGGNVSGGNSVCGTKGTVFIEGGSINSVVSPEPKNLSNKNVYQNTLKLPIDSYEEVKCTIDNNCTWKTTTLYNGYLYIYLPENIGDEFHTIEIIDSNSNVYTYKVTTKTDGFNKALEGLIIKEQPVSINVTIGNISEILNVNVIKVTGRTLNYQWYSNNSDSNLDGTLINGATNSEFKIPADSQVGEKYYYCVITSQGIDSVTSNAVKVIVNKKNTSNGSSSGSSSSKTSSKSSNTEIIDDFTDEYAIIKAINNKTAKIVLINFNNKNIMYENVTNLATTDNTPIISKNILNALKANSDITLVIKGETSTIELKSNAYKQIQFTQNKSPLTGFKFVGNGEYYLNFDGIMQSGWKQFPGDVWYHLNTETGAKDINWIQDTNNKWYYLDNISGIMKRGWLYYNSAWYYLNSDGSMKTGWIKDNDGKWYYLYFNGEMATNTTIDGYYVNYNGVWSE